MKFDVFVLDMCSKPIFCSKVAIEPQKVAPNTKLCSKVAEHNRKRPIHRPPDYLTKQSDFRRVYQKRHHKTESISIHTVNIIHLHFHGSFDKKVSVL